MKILFCLLAVTHLYGATFTEELTNQHLNLTNIFLDPAYEVKVSHAELILEGESVMVMLQPDFFCPEGQYCVQLMPAPIIYQTRIEESSVDPCHMRKTIAKNEQNETLISIFDYTKSTCESDLKGFVVVQLKTMLENEEGLVRVVSSLSTKVK